ncbi:MAG TPA: type II secretion system F family protein [Burkholderiales bacterium]|nr:type II secretion system F family protein [Burkholderiales bacterium]
MIRYRVKGVASSGSVVTLELNARDDSDAQEQARTRGVAVLALDRCLTWKPRMRSRRNRFPLLLFSQELLALLQSGISLIEAIQTLAEKEQRAEVRHILGGLMERLREGQPLSGAMEQGGAFPPLYVALVRASERTGDLAEALARYIAYQSQVDVLRKKLSAAAIYPAVLIAVGVLVTLFLLGYVVPRFSEIYAGMGSDLPWLSRMLMHWGGFVAQHGALAAAVACATLAFGAHRAMQPQTWQAVGRQLWRIPAIGERVRIFQLARFYRTLGMLQRGGIAIVPALAMVAGLLPASLRPSLELATSLVREGKPLSEAMERAGLTTSVALRMLRVGERSGRMGEMMERIAAFYDEEMARWVEWFTRLFEPLLMTVIGVLIGGIVLLLYLPIFELAGNIQ